MNIKYTCAEALEQRVLMSALGGGSARLYRDGILRIEGSKGSDRITVEYKLLPDGDGSAVQGIAVTINRRWRVFTDRNPSTGASPFAKKIEVSGKSGNDKIDCSGSSVVCVIHGDAGNDYLVGGRGTAIDPRAGFSYGDDLFGDTGHDTLRGGPGDDILEGGAGNDLLIGEDGDDGIYGNAGNDTLRGGRGEDGLDGGAGNDDLDGGPGADKLIGGYDWDNIHRDRDDDVLD